MNEITPVEAGAGALALGALGAALRWIRKHKILPAKETSDAVAKAVAKATLAVLGDPGAERPEDGTLAKLVKEAGDAAKAAAIEAGRAANEARLASENNAGALGQLSKQVADLSTQMTTSDLASATNFGELKGQLGALERRQLASDIEIARLSGAIVDTQVFVGMTPRGAGNRTPARGTPAPVAQVPPPQAPRHGS